MAELFNDPATAGALSKDGFVLLEAAIGSETERLEQYITRRFALPQTQFYYSLMANPAPVNLALRDTIRQTLQEFYRSCFADYRTVTESFLSKPPHTPDELLLHQDWCYTDEARYRAYNIWIPLCDVTEHNGAMFFLPGSHTWFRNYRSGSLATARIATGDLPDMPVQVVPMKKGDVLLFHPAVFHGSLPNRGNENRVVVTATVMDRDAPFLYYHAEKGEQVRVFNPGDDTLLYGLEPLAMGSTPDALERERFAYTHRMLTAADLQAQKRRYDQ